MSAWRGIDLIASAVSSGCIFLCGKYLMKNSMNKLVLSSDNCDCLYCDVFQSKINLVTSRPVTNFGSFCTPL